MFYLNVKLKLLFKHKFKNNNRTFSDGGGWEEKVESILRVEFTFMTKTHVDWEFKVWSDGLFNLVE